MLGRPVLSEWALAQTGTIQHRKLKEVMPDAQYCEAPLGLPYTWRRGGRRRSKAKAAAAKANDVKGCRPRERLSASSCATSRMTQQPRHILPTAVNDLLDTVVRRAPRPRTPHEGSCGGYFQVTSMPRKCMNTSRFGRS
jgi:hypothetical protein